MEFATARSTSVSPFRRPAKTEVGSCPTAKSWADSNAIVPGMPVFRRSATWPPGTLLQTSRSRSHVPVHVRGHEAVGSRARGEPDRRCRSCRLPVRAARTPRWSPLLESARSWNPSRSKSPATIARGPLRTDRGTPKGAKDPVPSLSRIDTVESASFATARSRPVQAVEIDGHRGGRLGPHRVAHRRAEGRGAGTLGDRTTTASDPLQGTARSSRPSASASTGTTACGPMST